MTGLLQVSELLATTVMILAVCALGVAGAQITSYENAVVAEVPGVGGGIQFAGLIVVGENARYLVPHEYGHYLQQRQYGTVGYIVRVGIPSLISGALLPADRHQSMPWEAEASELGGWISPEERMAQELERILEELGGKEAVYVGQS